MNIFLVRIGRRRRRKKHVVCKTLYSDSTPTRTLSSNLWPNLGDEYTRPLLLLDEKIGGDIGTCDLLVRRRLSSLECSDLTFVTLIGVSASALGKEEKKQNTNRYTTGTHTLRL